ncbi:hypothetical protein ACFV98_23620 [Streptomyces violascens]|uniref:hypothetical protein n=1 Tax=Streptomyces violascens TaxID=67381 RepID=UPI00365D0CB5
MVGLFWIDAESVHLGTPSATTASDVLLAPDSLRVVGPEPGEWPWSDVTAAGAYSRREVDLSRALLARFVDGTSSPAVLSDWWTSADPGALRSRGREAVLEEWLAAQ